MFLTKTFHIRLHIFSLCVICQKNKMWKHVLKCLNRAWWIERSGDDKTTEQIVVLKKRALKRRVSLEKVNRTYAISVVSLFHMPGFTFHNKFYLKSLSENIYLTGYYIFF